MIDFDNCLILYETELDYLHFHISEINKYFTKTISLNYTNYFANNGILKLQNHIEQIVADNSIKIIFVFHYVDNYELSPEFYNSLRSQCRLVFWMFDDEILLQAYSKFYVQTSDAVITTDFFGRAFYESIGIPTILYYSSYSKNDYYPKGLEKIYDVSFVGVVSETKADRTQYIRFLQDNGINVSLFGLGTENGVVTFEEMVDIFNKSKINLNFTGIDMLPVIYRYDPLLIARNKQNKGRPIEIALTNSFCLSEYAPSLPFVFAVGDEIDTFRNNEELLSKIRYYLENDPERERIAENAYKRALGEYESGIYIKNVMCNLFEKLSENEQFRTPELEIYVSDFFRKRRLFFYMRSIRHALKKLKLSLAFELFLYLLDNKYSLVDILKTSVLELFKIKTIGSFR